MAWVHDGELKEMTFRVCLSRILGESSVTESVLAGLSVLQLVNECQSVLAMEQTLLRLSRSFVGVGDIHGNIDDLLHIFSDFGWPPGRPCVSVGNCVGRGLNSIEVLLILYCLKLVYRQSFYLLRGNDECEPTDIGCQNLFKAKAISAFLSIVLASACVSGFEWCHGLRSPISCGLTTPLMDVSESVAQVFVWVGFGAV